MKVGDKVWIFDTNRRVYPKVNGRVTGGPIYAEHFVQAEITGETSKSWIVREGQRETKINKKTLAGIYTDEQKADKIWARCHRHDIVRLVQSCDVEQLKQIAKILNYEEGQ